MHIRLVLTEDDGMFVEVQVNTRKEMTDVAFSRFAKGVFQAMRRLNDGPARKRGLWVNGVGPNAQKIAAIKALRGHEMGLGLKEAKDIIDTWHEKTGPFFVDLNGKTKEQLQVVANELRACGYLAEYSG